MSFSPDSILERTRKNNKGKRSVGLFHEPDYKCESNNGNF
jgi:hypothetical protein